MCELYCFQTLNSFHYFNLMYVVNSWSFDHELVTDLILTVYDFVNGTVELFKELI